MCLRLPGRHSPTAGLTVNLGRAGSPETEPRTTEVWAVASAPRRAGTLQKPSRLQKSGGLAGRGPLGASGCGLQARTGGWPQEGLPPQGGLPPQEGLPPHGGRSSCPSPSMLGPQCPAHSRCSANPCYMHSKSSPFVPGVVLRVPLRLQSSRRSPWGTAGISVF